MDQLLSFLAPYALCHEHKQLEETILQSLLVVNRPTIELPSLQRIYLFTSCQEIHNSNVHDKFSFQGILEE